MHITLRDFVEDFFEVWWFGHFLLLKSFVDDGLCVVHEGTIQLLRRQRGEKWTVSWLASPSWVWAPRLLTPDASTTVPLKGAAPQGIWALHFPLFSSRGPWADNPSRSPNGFSRFWFFHLLWKSRFDEKLSRSRDFHSLAIFIICWNSLLSEKLKGNVSLRGEFP